MIKYQVVKLVVCNDGTELDSTGTELHTYSTTVWAGCPYYSQFQEYWVWKLVKDGVLFDRGHKAVSSTPSLSEIPPRKITYFDLGKYRVSVQ